MGGLWEGSRVPHSCLSVIETEVPLDSDDRALQRYSYCNSMENELKSYHNKTN